MSDKQTYNENHNQHPCYEIRLKGHLDDRWAEWFEGLNITLEDNGDTLLTGPLVDQAALHGLLKKVRDLGMPLVSVNRVQLNRTHPYRSKKGEKMKAIIYTKYGPPDVFHLEEVKKPVLNENQVLVKVHAASINASDWHLLTADPFPMRLIGTGLLKPKNPILGVDIAGCVEAVGRNIKQFRPGDAVFGDIFGLGSGSFAEYVSVPESALALKPSNISFEEAAAVPVAAVTALQGLRDQGHIQPGQKVLINGASGGVGTFAVQIAKAFGAEVTAVCSTRNLEMARSIGADHVIDYTKEDFTQNGAQYDLILAVNGYQPISAYKRALSPQGVYVFVGGLPKQTFQSLFLGPLMSEGHGRKMTSVMKKGNHEDLLLISDLLENGKIRPVIDECYPLCKTTEAFRYFEKGHARGKVVITIAAKE